MMIQFATITFCILISILVIFQLALALGMPWGEYAMGGYYPGQYPPKMRAVSVVQIVFYLLMTAVVLSRAGVAIPEIHALSRIVIWPIVMLFGLGVVMNLASRSKWERRIWTPVALTLLCCTTLIALS